MQNRKVKQLEKQIKAEADKYDSIEENYRHEIRSIRRDLNQFKDHVARNYDEIASQLVGSQNGDDKSEISHKSFHTDNRVLTDKYFNILNAINTQAKSRQGA